MSQWTVGSGSGGQLRLTLEQVSQDKPNDRSTVRVRLEGYVPAGTWFNDEHGASLSGGYAWSGSWSAPGSSGSGGRWITIREATFTVNHAANGTGSVTVSGSIAATGTGGMGGPTSTGNRTLTLSTITVPPGQPTGVTATWVSDSQVTVAWVNHSSPNGVPTGIGVDQSVNGGAWTRAFTTGSIVTSTTVPTAANRKTIYRVVESNGAGSAPNSESSAAVYTTPSAPTGVQAVKGSTGIVVSWANNVGFTEYQTELRHGVVAAGVTTWDSAPLATLAASTATYTHANPNTSQVHVYELRAVNTSGGLASAQVQSNSVQLLAAPLSPTLTDLPSFTDRAVPLAVTWVHHPVDTTAQTAYELGYSTNGGTTWASTGKVASTMSSYTVPAGTYAGNAAVTMRVRTWGLATTGGSDGAGASPWSTQDTVAFQTAPVASIVSPTEVTESTTDVVVGFTQAEGATLVRATVVLILAGEVVETAQRTTTTVPLVSRLLDGGVYTLQVSVLDSHGIASAVVTGTFSVDYVDPQSALVDAGYVPESGTTQLTLTLAADPDKAAPVAVTITRTIGGATETLLDRLPWDGTIPLTVLDTTPVVNGVNTYEVVTFTADGAASPPQTAEVAATEDRWAFLNAGPGFASVVAFYGNLSLGTDPQRTSALIQAAGRSRPIALFGEVSTLDISGSATIVPGEGSTVQDIEAFLLTAGRVCYRDPSGRRVFGLVSGKLDSWTAGTANFTYTVSEAT